MRYVVKGRGKNVPIASDCRTCIHAKTCKYKDKYDSINKANQAREGFSEGLFMVFVYCKNYQHGVYVIRPVRIKSRRVAIPVYIPVTYPVGIPPEPYVSPVIYCSTPEITS